MSIFEYIFFQHAILGSLLASIICGLVGTYIVTRRLVFISGGITHASFGGIGLGVFFGINPILSAAVFSVLSAWGVQWFSHRSDMREDSAIAVFWTFGIAIGIIFSFLTPGFLADLSSFLFGNILTITNSDLWLLAILTIFVGTLFALMLKPIVAIAFDREFARSQRLPVEGIEYLMMTVIALTIVSCLRMIGIVLVISLLTLPQMTANLFCKQFKHIMLLAIPIGFVSCIGGLFISYHLNIPSGATIICVSILIYGLCKIFQNIKATFCTSGVQ
ncbi:MAG: metal ABC transporter permease [Bacteroidaceae bacterium]|nr:metal ABC transporter permease [Bacteroidaceae bacterium]